MGLREVGGSLQLMVVFWGAGRLDLLEHQFETLDGQSRRGHPPPPATNPAQNPRLLHIPNTAPQKKKGKKGKIF